jgi:hypothetical protein
MVDNALGGAKVLLSVLEGLGFGTANVRRVARAVL